MNGNDLVEFEENNWDWLTEKFMKVPVVMELWEQFVMDEHSNQPEPPEDENDR